MHNTHIVSVITHYHIGIPGEDNLKYLVERVITFAFAFGYVGRSDGYCGNVTFASCVRLKILHM